jgi:hypothetical protein
MQSDKNFDKYDKEFVTFTIEQASQLYIRLMGVILVALVAPFIYVHFQSFHSYFSNFSWLTFMQDFFLFIIFILLGIILHELIHGLTWALFVKERLRAIKFGVLWKYLTPYCHCKSHLKVKHYIAGAITPAIILGMLPTLWAFINGDIMLFFLGSYFIVAASGDFLIIYLLRNEAANSYVKDHETLPGCIIYKLKNQK